MSHAKDVARAKAGNQYRNDGTKPVVKMQEMSDDQKAFIREIEAYLPKAPDDARDVVAKLLQALKSRTLSKGEMDKIRKVYESSKATIESPPKEHKPGLIEGIARKHTIGIIEGTIKKLAKENRLLWKNGSVRYTDKSGITHIKTPEVIAGMLWDKLNEELTKNTMGMGNLATLDIQPELILAEIAKLKEE